MTTIKRVITVTPEMAKNCLAKNPNNRRINDDTVRHYARMMSIGEWIEGSPENFIVFDENDNLIDGQHRLSAVVYSGIPIKFTVWRGCPREIILHLNQGKIRRFGDRAKFLGRVERQGDLSIAKMIKYGPKNARHKKLTPEQEFNIIQEYWEGINFARSIHQNGKWYITPLKTIIARASYTQDKKRLIRFIHVFVTGEVKDKGDYSVLKLKDCLISYRMDHKMVHQSEEFYFKAESALRAFLAGKDLSKLNGTDGEIYKVPGEV